MSKKQLQYKNYETKFDRKAGIANKLRRREIIERSSNYLNKPGSDDDYENDYEAYLKNKGLNAQNSQG